MKFKYTNDSLVKLSFVIPVYNEEHTISPLFDIISKVMAKEGIESYEAIFIDDGSTDSSWTVMEALVSSFPEKIKAIQFRKNFGKAAALNAGFKEARGEIIFSLDADLQDDPEEIPKFLEKLSEGYDLVSGWKEKRRDPVSKTLPSRIFNRVTVMISGIELHDFSCGFKAYRRETIESIELYGELHRFIPLLVHDLGFKVAEVSVQHKPRRYGVSKYGFERYARGFLDLLTVIAITRYLQRPGHLFGGLGIISGIFGIISITYLVILWFLGYRPIGNRPLLLFGIMAVILSVQLISLGLLGELFVRNNNPRPVGRMIKKILYKQRINEENSSEENALEDTAAPIN